MGAVPPGNDNLIGLPRDYPETFLPGTVNQGHIIFLLSVSSLHALIDCLDAYLRAQGLA